MAFGNENEIDFRTFFEELTHFI